MALELARHGIQARIFERTPLPHHQARATALQPGTLEILARAGILDDFLAAAHPLPYARLLDADLNVVGETPFAQVDCRWGFQASLPQYRTEAILTAHLAARGVEVERAVDVTAVEPGDDHVSVVLRRSDGQTETVQAGWVVGAGGAGSITRHSMAETLQGATYPGTALAGDVKVRGNVPRDGGSLVATPHGYVLLAALPDERWITFIGTLDEDEERQLALDCSLEGIAAALHRRIRAQLVLEDVAWASLFQMQHRQAPRLAGERRFLLGDAGHLSSPFGGEGLNSGLHDAHNLAWKLALVIHGRGRAGLLDTFGYERESADRHVVDVSNQLHEFVNAAVRAEQTGVRPKPATPAQARAMTRSRAMLDVSYAGSPIVGELAGGQGAFGDEFETGCRWAEATQPFTSHQLLLFGAADAAAAERLSDRWRGLVDVIDATGRGGPRTGAILVRPDGFIGFRSAAADAPALDAVDAHLSSYLI